MHRLITRVTPNTPHRILDSFIDEYSNQFKQAYENDEKNSAKKVMDTVTNISRKENEVTTIFLANVLDKTLTIALKPYNDFLKLKNSDNETRLKEKEKCIAWLKIIFFEDANATFLRTVAFTMPVFISLQKCGLESFSKLLMAGEAKNDGRKSIHFAARTANLPLLEYLLSLGADINQPDHANFTPLMHSAIPTQGRKDEDKIAIFKFLLRQPKINLHIHDTLPDSLGCILHLLTVHHDLPILECLAKSKLPFDIESLDANGYTPLMVASSAMNGDTHFDFAKRLLELGANVHATDTILIAITNPKMLALLEEYKKKHSLAIAPIKSLSLSEALATKDESEISKHLFAKNKRKSSVKITENILNKLFENGLSNILNNIFAFPLENNKKTFFQELSDAGDNWSLLLRAIEIYMLAKNPHQTSKAEMLANFIAENPALNLLSHKKFKQKFIDIFLFELYENSASSEPNFKFSLDWKLVEKLLSLPFDKIFFLQLANANIKIETLLLLPLDEKLFSELKNDKVEVVAFENIANEAKILTSLYQRIAQLAGKKSSPTSQEKKRDAGISSDGVSANQINSTDKDEKPTNTPVDNASSKPKIDASVNTSIQQTNNISSSKKQNDNIKKTPSANEQVNANRSKSNHSQKNESVTKQLDAVEIKTPAMQSNTHTKSRHHDKLFLKSDVPVSSTFNKSQNFKSQPPQSRFDQKASTNQTSFHQTNTQVVNAILQKSQKQKKQPKIHQPSSTTTHLMSSQETPTTSVSLTPVSSWSAKTLPHQVIPFLKESTENLLKIYKEKPYSISSIDNTNETKAVFTIDKINNDIQAVLGKLISAIQHQPSESLSQHQKTLQQLFNSLQMIDDPFTPELTLLEKVKLIATYRLALDGVMNEVQLLAQSLTSPDNANKLPLKM